MRMPSPLIRFMVLSAFFLSLQAQTTTWNPGLSGNWSDPANWTPAVGVPTGTTPAVIDATGQTITVNQPSLAQTLTLSAGTVQIANQLLQVGDQNGVNLQGLTLGSGAILSMDNYGGLLLESAAGGPSPVNRVLNNGAINVGYSGGLYVSGSWAVTGNGQLNLNGNLTLQAGSTLDFTAAPLQLQYVSGGELTGGGYVLAGTLLTGGADINTIDWSARVTFDGGQMISAGAAGHDLAQTLTTNNGSVAVGAGVTVALTSGSFLNTGSLDLSPGSTLDLGTAHFQNLDASGTLDGGNYIIGGTLYHHGADINTIGPNARVGLEGGQMMGALGGNDITQTLITNNGTLAVSVDTALTSGSFQNNGMLYVNNGATLNLTAAHLQNVTSGGTLVGGMYEINGTLLTGGADINTLDAYVELDGGRMMSAQGHDITQTLATIDTNGWLILDDASRTLTGPLLNNGGLFLENYSTLTSQFDITNTNNGVIEIGQYSTLTLTSGGSFQNNGTLSLLYGATANLRNANFQNVSSGGILSGGSYYLGVGATLLHAGADIDTIGANTELRLGGGQMSGTSGKDITGTLTTNNGTLTIGAPTAFTSGHFTNSGTLSVQSGATLNLTGAPLQNVVGGVLSGGSYVLEGTLFHGAGDIATIGAGTSVSLDGTGHMYSNSGHDITATLTTNNGELDIVGYTPVTLTAGGLTNNGTLNVETYGGGFEIAGNVTNSGIFEVLGMSSPDVGAKIDGNFINSPGGTLWVGETPMVVNGSFTNAQGGVAAVDACANFPGLSECFWSGYAPGLTVLGDFTNDGTFSVKPVNYYGLVTDVQVTVDGSATNSGTLTLASGTTFTSAEFHNTGGTLLLDGSIVGPVDISGGTIDGDGLFTGNVTQSGGTLKPGESPGTLTIDGDYSMGSGATLQIDFLNTTGGPGTGWGFLNVTGNATLGGRLNLMFLNPLTFAAGEMFEIMHYSAWLGGNLTLDAPALAGLHFTTLYGADQLDLRVDTNSGSATPEPGTWELSMAALALAAAAGWVRRKA